MYQGSENHFRDKSQGLMHQAHNWELQVQGRREKWGHGPQKDLES